MAGLEDLIKFETSAPAWSSVAGRRDSSIVIPTVWGVSPSWLPGLTSAVVVPPATTSFPYRLISNVSSYVSNPDGFQYFIGISGTHESEVVYNPVSDALELNSIAVGFHNIISLSISLGGRATPILSSTIDIQFTPAQVAWNASTPSAISVTRTPPFPKSILTNIISAYLYDPLGVSTVSVEGALPNIHYDSGNGGQILVDADPGVDGVLNVDLVATVPDTVTVATMQITSSVGGSLLPFTFGQAFKAGDVPAGQYLTSTIPGFQTDVRNKWPDGSVKFAVISGRQTLTANVASTVPLQKTATPPSGTNVSEPTAVSYGAGQANAIVLTIAGHAAPYTPAAARTAGITPWNKATPRKVREILGPVMSEFHYYVPTTDNYLSIWWYVRAYADGRLEVETVVENSWIALTGAVKVYTPTLVVGSNTYAPGSLTQYHHTRWSRVDWIGGNPSITPRHDVAYLRSTKLIPNYGYNNPTAAAADGSIPLNPPFPTQINPTPFALGSWSPDMGAYGGAAPIGPLPRWEAVYFGSAPANAYVATISNQRGSGRWSMHMRDDLTGRPALYESFPNMSFDQGWGSPDLDGQSTGGSYGTYDIAHLPSQGYGPYLLEGRWSFIESLQMSAIFCLMSSNPSNRTLNGSTGLLAIQSPLTTRGVAWAIRTMAQAATITPVYLNNVAVSGADIMQPQLRKSIDDTATYNYGKYVTGTIPGGPANTIGFIGDYDGDTGHGDTNIWTRIWMQDYQAIALAMASDLGIEGLTAGAALNAVRDHAYTRIVGRFGNDGTWNFRRAAQYQAPIKNAGGTLLTIAQAYAALVAATGMGPLSANSGEALTTGGNTILVNDDSSEFAGNGYWAIVLAALVYAKDHGKAGADAAYALLQASWAAHPTQEPHAMGMDDQPEFGLVPR